ncbi:MAG: PACE efflux transporter [Desulfobacter sp.]|nr:MAG: PACE efflux transporter [Desulfobacter sp.]
MRNFRERVMHTLLFELVLLGICMPLISILFNKSMSHAGMMSLGLSLTAMVCNGVYNYVFDRVLLLLKRPLYPRSLALRSFHSILFEVFLLFFSLPLIMWWLDLSFYRALALDVSMACFVPLYALGFNWLFDIVFPPKAMACRAEG